MEQLSPCATTTDPCSRACPLQLLNPNAATTEAHVPRALAAKRAATTMRSPRTAVKSSLCLLQLEKACTARKTQDNFKKKKWASDREGADEGVVVQSLSCV